MRNPEKQLKELLKEIEINNQKTRELTRFYQKMESLVLDKGASLAVVKAKTEAFIDKGFDFDDIVEAYQFLDYNDGHESDWEKVDDKRRFLSILDYAKLYYSDKNDAYDCELNADIPYYRNLGLKQTYYEKSDMYIMNTQKIKNTLDTWARQAQDLCE